MKIIWVLILILSVMECENSGVQRFEDNPYINYQSFQSNNGTNIYFIVVMPENYTADSTYPVLITFPPGSQSKELAEGALEAYWITSSIKTGWIVISPISPNDTLYFEGAEKYVPELMAWIKNQFKVEGNKFHFAGSSNGGLSAFRIALDHTQDVQSLTVLPGYPPGPNDYGILDRLKYIPINMYVGEYDKTFRSPMESTYNKLREIKAWRVSLEIRAGEGHVLQKLTSAELLAVLETTRPEH